MSASKKKTDSTRKLHQSVEMDLEIKKAKRFEFLKALYDAVDGSPRSYVNMWELGTDIGFDRKTTDNIVEYLVDQNLVEYFAIGGNIVITHSGVLEIEEAVGNPNKPTEHFSPINIINVESMTNSAIQQGTTNSNQSTIFNANDLSKLDEVVRLLEETTAKLDISSEQLSELTSEIETIKSQRKSPKPKRVIINESLKTIRNVIESTAVKAATTGLVEMIKGLTF